ncbi:hypothetical protein JZ751_004508, partial [Albula glossodonta]
MAGIPGLLAATLDELYAEELKRFRWTLTHNVPEGFRPIPRGKLQNMDVPGTVDLMLDTYGGEGAVRVTLHTLRKTDQRELAQRLEKDYCESSKDGDPDKVMTEFQKNLKLTLAHNEWMHEVHENLGQSSSLNDFYTELYITEGSSGGVCNQHEVRLVEKATKTQETQDTAILLTDIFKPLPGQKRPIRTVLTKGIAGIGKTVSVQKFI